MLLRKKRKLNLKIILMLLLTVFVSNSIFSAKLSEHIIASLEQNKNNLVEKHNSITDETSAHKKELFNKYSSYYGANNSRLFHLKVENFLLKQTEEDYDINTAFLDPETLNNSPIFNNPENPLKTLFGEIENTEYPVCCSLELAKLLVNPASEIKQLKNKQDIIKTLVNNQSLLNNLDEHLKKFKELEETYLNYYAKVNKNLLQQQSPGYLKNKLDELKKFASNKTNFIISMISQTMFNILPMAKATYAYLWDPIETAAISYWSPTFYLTLALKMFGPNPMAPLILMSISGIPVHEFFYLAVPFYGIKLGYNALKPIWNKLKNNKDAKDLINQTEKMLASLNEMKKIISKNIKLKQFFVKEDGDENNSLFSMIGKIGAYVTLAKLVTDKKWNFVKFASKEEFSISTENYINSLSQTILNFEINKESEINKNLLNKLIISIITAHTGIIPAKKLTITPVSFITTWLSSAMDMNREINRATILSDKVTVEKKGIIFIEKNKMQKYYEQNENALISLNALLNNFYGTLKEHDHHKMIEIIS